ncbi:MULTISPECIES: hypothetical protein [Methylosinus]|uniref:Uncharacterized protein n=1 Tax=Methylosinus trichosporium (strain ATCC 35070 / NCIMB 11131 / UNIQEM 75 / OB3b) TaxID=595536 RepID=A0A2D2CZZ5_METT3|nr:MULTISPECIES: hypothetical protein [Methylosinus]ATQ68328.1 hypothetical protein CQW49_10885 [Methylosinus trichosporium OB3b]OBS50933.1 hypothetical protein A8B73_18775 [Methylosinus sp. 3S-1]
MSAKEPIEEDITQTTASFALYSAYRLIVVVALAGIPLDESRLRDLETEALIDAAEVMEDMRPKASREAISSGLSVARELFEKYRSWRNSA